jgi:hypothetical protein
MNNYKPTGDVCPMIDQKLPGCAQASCRRGQPHQPTRAIGTLSHAANRRIISRSAAGFWRLWIDNLQSKRRG